MFPSNTIYIPTHTLFAAGIVILHVFIRVSLLLLVRFRDKASQLGAHIVAGLEVMVQLGRVRHKGQLHALHGIKPRARLLGNGSHRLWVAPVYAQRW